MNTNLLYLGIKGSVLAIDKQTGATLWQTKLKSGSMGESFVTVLVEANRVFAHTYGEAFCLDASTGGVLWHNPLTGLGYGLATLAVHGAASSPTAAELKRAEATTAAAVAASS